MVNMNWENGVTPLNAATMSEFQRQINNAIHPIGSIYISVSEINPSELFGGTWESFGKGRTLVGIDTAQEEFDTIEKIGGSKTVVLTEGQLARHKHGLYMVDNVGGLDLNVPASNQSIQSWNSSQAMLEAGNNEAHENMSPYIVTYMWKRIS